MQASMFRITVGHCSALHSVPVTARFLDIFFLLVDVGTDHEPVVLGLGEVIL
jgi:hypothetical protein